MESLNKLDEVYCREAKWTLENAFPMIRIHAIHAVFTYSKENFTDAFAYLAEIEDCRSTIKGLGRGEFGHMIPRHIDTFIKLKRKEKRFEITSERLCGERDTVALDTTQCDHELLPAIEAVKTLVADTKRDYRDVLHVNSVDHVLCNKHSINFVSAMLHTQEEYVHSGEIRVAASPGNQYLDERNCHRGRREAARPFLDSVAFLSFTLVFGLVGLYGLCKGSREMKIVSN